MNMVHKNNQSYYYIKTISKNTVEVSKNLGWISVIEDDGHTGVFGIAGKRQYTKMSMTTEDALNLITALQKLITLDEELK